MAAMPPMTGVYNIPVEPGSPYIHHQTVRRLPSMKRFYSERSGIAERLRQVIGGYLDDGGFPTHNEILQEVFGRYAVGDYPSDRTMCFFVGDLDAFTPDFIRILQEQVLADYPLWRLKAQFEERSIGVYPQGAWLGDQWVAGPSTATHLAYRKRLIEAREYREKRFGPLSSPAGLCQAAYSGGHGHGLATTLPWAWRVRLLPTASLLESLYLDSANHKSQHGRAPSRSRACPHVCGKPGRGHIPRIL